MSALSVGSLSKAPPDDDDEDEDPDFNPSYVVSNAAAVPPVRSPLDTAATRWRCDERVQFAHEAPLGFGANGRGERADGTMGRLRGGQAVGNRTPTRGRTSAAAVAAAAGRDAAQRARRAGSSAAGASAGGSAPPAAASPARASSALTSPAPAVRPAPSSTGKRARSAASSPQPSGTSSPTSERH
jgi:hypothetical protein